VFSAFCGSDTHSIRNFLILYRGWGVWEVQSDDGGCFLGMGIGRVNHRVSSGRSPFLPFGGWGCVG
jgi:hypothetical protein